MVREQGKDKGFWNGGSTSHGTNDQAGGKASSAPGVRTPSHAGVRTDIEFPEIVDPADERQA